MAQASETYQIGDIGTDIANVQTKLNSLGFNVGTADGIFGAMTENGVKAFQAARGVDANGIIDANTYRLLMERDMPPVSRGASNATVRRLIQTAMNYIGVPYVFGGTTPSGFDCSGFTSFVFAKVGVHLPRMADEQYYAGISVPFRSLQPGDMVFFTTYTYGISHCGIYIGDGRFISATSSRGIKIDSLDSSYWGPRYVAASRVL